MTVVHMIGNAHLDPVWLWGWQAGVDEALATLSAAADRCDEYPDFIFTCGEAWRYRQVERLRPALFARIRRRVAEGRWFIAGGTLVQPDLNLPTAMAVCRQILHGQSYFQDRFAVRPRIGFNVDSFGHPAFLPDLYAAHGYTAYVLSRPDPRQFDIPAAAFLWRGAGGAELPAFRIVDGYGYVAPDLRDHILHALAGSDPALGHTMCFYGVGDHGGGPTRRQLDWIIENRTAIPGAELRFSTPQAFFAAIADRHALLPRVEGELQHCFPGCYSAMGDIKRAQRRGEELLDQAERTIRAFSPATAQPAHLKAIDTAWEDLLFTAFHDIAAGTATPSAWQSCRAMQGRARIIAETTLLDVTRLWAHQALPPSPDPQIVIINTDDAPFDGLVEHETFLDFDLWQDRILTTADGTPLPFQQVQPDAMQRVPRLIFPVRIPPRTATTVLIRRVPSSPNPAPPAISRPPRSVSPTPASPSTSPPPASPPSRSTATPCSPPPGSPCTCARTTPTPGPTAPTASPSRSPPPCPAPPGKSKNPAHCAPASAWNTASAPHACAGPSSCTATTPACSCASRSTSTSASPPCNSPPTSRPPQQATPTPPPAAPSSAPSRPSNPPSKAGRA